MSTDPWHKAAKGKVHERVFTFVRQIEQEQGDTFDRFVKLESLYDPFSPMGNSDGERNLVNVTENVVAGNIDTVHAAVATTEVRARIQTDDADYSTQRRARHMELYAEAITKQINLHPKCRLAFKASAKKGGGVVKVWADRWRDLRAMHVPLDDIVVPDADARDGAPPRQLHHVDRNCDKDELAAEFPEYETEIRNAGNMRTGRASGWSTRSPDRCVKIESWRLPIGKRPKKGATRRKGDPVYVPGRHTVTIDGHDLLDEPYHKPYYPLACISWLSREGSFYGISLAERIAGIQRALNKRNWQIDRVLDQSAHLTTYVRPADANITVKTTKAGNMAIVRGDMPLTPTPPLVNPETYQSRIDLRGAAYEESGVSQLAAQGKKPAGLDSGTALREYRDQTTQRFAPQEQDFEQLVLDAIWLALDACKDLGVDAPNVVRQSRWQPQIPWSKVDIGDVRIQIAAASTLPRTPAGRQQTVIEWAQAGVISQDEARRLMRHPDLERAMSLYTAALESVEEQLEMILDGEIVVPEPFDNLQMCMWRGTAQYHNTRAARNAPEEILEGLRQYVVQAGYLLAQRESANANAMAGGPGMMGAPAAAQQDLAGAGVPALPEAPPAAAPVAAFAPQAMQLMAG